VRYQDIDWRLMLNSWDKSDIEALKNICEEKLRQIAQIRK